MSEKRGKKVARRATKAEARKPDPIRLVKLWLPASLIRSVDEVVTVSDGAYRDRDEFFAEAARDRLREETERRAGGEDSSAAEASVSSVGLPALGTWRAAKIPTARGLPAEAHTGLHNRDTSTLWVLDVLLSLVSVRAGIPYADLIGIVTAQAQQLGARLAERDRYREQGALKASVGFPAPDQATSADRFRLHMIGEIISTGPNEPPRLRGPLFAFGLASVRDGLVFPTEAGKNLLAHLVDDGFSLVPPQPEAAWLRFRTHLAEALPLDLAALRTVLEACVATPTRSELVAAFTPRWKDGTGIQLTGLVSRLREWGLLAARLESGRYAITTAGEHELARASAEVAA